MVGGDEFLASFSVEVNVSENLWCVQRCLTGSPNHKSIIRFAGTSQNNLIQKHHRQKFKACCKFVEALGIWKDSLWPSISCLFYNISNCWFIFFYSWSMLFLDNFASIIAVFSQFPIPPAIQREMEYVFFSRTLIALHSTNTVLICYCNLPSCLFFIIKPT